MYAIVRSDSRGALVDGVDEQLHKLVHVVVVLIVRVRVHRVVEEDVR